jgi:Uma2 family endonuclease
MTTEVADAPTLAELGITWVPDHTQLPETDGSIVQNFQEHPQSILLTDSIMPVLRRLHPDEQYCVGQDSGIYWNLNIVQGDNPIRGAVAPDWFYVANVPPTFKGQLRRPYVMWQEIIAPLIAIEFVSGDGGEERAEQADQRAEQERERAEALAARLRALGIDPEADSGI